MNNKNYNFSWYMMVPLLVTVMYYFYILKLSR